MELDEELLWFRNLADFSVLGFMKDHLVGLTQTRLMVVDLRTEKVRFYKMPIVSVIVRWRWSLRSESVVRSSRRAWTRRRSRISNVGGCSSSIPTGLSYRKKGSPIPDLD